LQPSRTRAVPALGRDEPPTRPETRRSQRDQGVVLGSATTKYGPPPSAWSSRSGASTRRGYESRRTTPLRVGGDRRHLSQVCLAPLRGLDPLDQPLQPLDLHLRPTSTSTPGRIASSCGDMPASGYETSWANCPRITRVSGLAALATSGMLKDVGEQFDFPPRLS